jgi:hypothetical protein
MANELGNDPNSNAGRPSRTSGKPRRKPSSHKAPKRGKGTKGDQQKGGK